MRLGYKIATRFLKSNKGQTILIILGIAIGVSVQIFIGSLIQGLQKGLIDKTIGNSSQITITSNTDTKDISDYRKLIEKVLTVDSNIEEVSVASDNSAFLEYGKNSQSILIRGFEIEQADRIYNIIDRIEEGTYPKSDNEIILGIDLKTEYGIKINDKINITTAKQKMVKCKVVGFFDLKVASINNNWGITTLPVAQKIFDTGDSVTSIEMQEKSDAEFLVDEIAIKLSDELKDDSLTVDNWKDQNEQLLSGLQGQSISSIMIQVFVLISVVLGIASVLAITVMQKSKQIGILKAMGIKNSSASFVFLFEGLILGFFGALAGIMLGLGLSFAFTKFALNPDGTPVIGQSGSGKRTILNIMGTLDKPTSGEVLIDGANVKDLANNKLAELRNNSIGFVFQFHYLLPEFTAIENVLMPYEIKNSKISKEIINRAEEYLKLVGLENVKNNMANKMSGGQQQRTAIARALINNPKIILADEPTGNLDSESTEKIYELLRKINQDFGTTFVIITHDKRIAEKADRIIEIKDGRINLDIEK